MQCVKLLSVLYKNELMMHSSLVEANWSKNQSSRPFNDFLEWSISTITVSHISMHTDGMLF